MNRKDQVLLESLYAQVVEESTVKNSPKIIEESSVVKVKVVRKVDTDEFVVKVYVNGKYDEEASYYTNDKQDAFATKQSILNRYKEHGYIVEESAKKVNPWAVEKSIEKKTGKTFGKKHKEEIIKGIKKSAKKAGKKITSDKVKPSKK